MSKSVAIPPEMNASSFSELSLQSLDTLIERYERALSVKVVDQPLGTARETVQEWLDEARTEWDKREAKQIDEEESESA